MLRDKQLVSALVIFSTPLLAMCSENGPDGSTAKLGELVQNLEATDYYVSPTGCGTSCTQAHPCSLDTAQGIVRQAAPNMVSDIHVWLKGGTYSRPTGAMPGPLLTFAPEDSGANGHDIVYAAMPDETPVLSGGTTLTGWSLYDASKNIYRASLGTTAPAGGSLTRQFYVNGVRAIRARGQSNPAAFAKTSTGWNVPDPSIALYGRTNGQAPDAPSYVEVVSRQKWKSFRCPISSLTVADSNLWVNAVMGSDGTVKTWAAGAGQGLQYVPGDFSGDGKTDVLLAGVDPNDTERWHNKVMSSTGGSFAEPSDWGLPDKGQGLAYFPGDFNGDGKTDILVPSLDGTTWHSDVMLSTGSSFLPSQDWGQHDAGQGGGVPYHVGDFNGDGKTDVLFAYRNLKDNVWYNDVMLSDGSSFAASRDWLQHGTGQGGMPYLIGDYNGDGKDDVLFAFKSANVWRNYVMPSTGSAFYSLSPWGQQGTGQGLIYHPGDYDGDGKTDVLFHDPAGGPLNNFLMRASGSLVPWGQQGTGSDASYLIGNFDGIAGSEVLLTHTVPVTNGGTSLAVAPGCWQRAQSLTGATMDSVSWLENAYELIDEEGEWYHDPLDGYVYYKPRAGEDLSTAITVAARLETLVEGKGSAPGTPNPAFVQHLQFQGLTFAYGTWLEPSADGYPEIQAGLHLDRSGKAVRTPGNVSFSMAHDVRFERNVFVHMGAVGLDIIQGHHNSVVGNVFSDISSSGIQLGQHLVRAPATIEQTDANTIADNFVTNVGVEYEGAVGIWVGIAAHTTIEHNEVANLPYSGISVGWGWGSTEPSYAGSNRLVGNDIHDVLRTLSDGGGIYTLNFQPDSFTQGNHIHGIGHPGQTKFYCLYHDEGSAYYTDTANVFENGPYAYWLSLWTTSIHDNTIQDNYAGSDRAYCNNKAVASQSGSPSPCDFHGNVTTPNTITGDPLPAAAQAIASDAGISIAYANIKNGW